MNKIPHKRRHLKIAFFKIAIKDFWMVVRDLICDLPLIMIDIS